MNIKIVLKMISLLLLIIAGFMVVPAGIAAYCRETASLYSFLYTIAGTLTISVFFLFLFRKVKSNKLSTRDGFLFVTGSWVFASFCGALPFYLSDCIPSFTNAFFETISGFSTTGASILTGTDTLPRSMLFWRSLTHWLGGMGIVVLAVAILPLLGIGGMQLIKAEAPGPTIDKLTPRITETAKLLWYIYTGLTVIETLLLMAGGMGLYDALTHTFGTLATGGFSTKNTSVGHFNSAYIDYVITFFMIIAGVNFILHFNLLTGRYKSLFKDTEFKAYLLIFLFSTILVTLNLHGHMYDSIEKSFRYASFQCATILTTTGFATTDYEKWPYFSQMILFMLMFVGGCSGSTGGGIKVIRIVTLFKQALNEMNLLLHPRGVFTLRIRKAAVRKNIVYAISGFFFLYIVLLLIVTSVVAFSGHDLLTAFTASLATVGNIGPGFGRVGPTENYAFFEDYVKWVLSFGMLTGRLELYTVLVLFTPRFWR